MTRWMLDTCICIELLRGRSPGVFHRLRGLANDEVAISSITLAELYHGAAKRADPDLGREVLEKFRSALTVALFDIPAAEAYAQVRGGLERAGTPIGPLDMLIASHALSLGAVLVTANEREFRRVPGLIVENWLRP